MQAARKISLWVAGAMLFLIASSGAHTLKLCQAALALRRGGVGYYLRSDFIHVDVGRLRQWCFDCPASVIVGD